MKKSHITIHDIAKELNISASTVSRALSGHPRISKATRTAVRELAEKYAYQPNVMASSLRKGKGNTIGVIVPRINRHFFSNVIGGIEEVLAGAGYNLMICQTGEDAAQEEAAVNTLINARVNGILMSVSSGTNDFDHLEQVLRKNVRLILFDRITARLPVSTVTINDHKGAFMATDHLLSQGYRRIICMTGPAGLNIYHDRRQGYLDAMKARGTEVEPGWVLEGRLLVDSGREAFRSFSKWNKPPEAVVCAGDYAALGIMLEARERGWKIPDDLAVTGFANEPFTEFIDPGLSSVDQHSLEMGRTVARLFLDENGEEEEIRQVILEPDLICRGSSVKKQ
ncbi:MAG: LacI family DNA-binding transcriptional regulator [Bacteroidota bacterium]